MRTELWSVSVRADRIGRAHMFPLLDTLAASSVRARSYLIRNAARIRTKVTHQGTIMVRGGRLAPGPQETIAKCLLTYGR